MSASKRAEAGWRNDGSGPLQSTSNTASLYPNRAPPVLEEARERRRVLVALLTAGMDDFQVRDEMQRRYGLTPGATKQLQRRVLDEWAELDADRRPHLKRTQRRRILMHVQDAKSDKNYAAVASLERLLAQIDGTLEPLEVSVKVDAQVRESVMVVLSQLSPERVRALADRQRSLRLEAARTVVDAEGESVGEGEPDEQQAG